MAIQSVVVAGLILLCGTLAVHMARHKILDREGWIVANAVVMLAGALGLGFHLAWAAWLTAALFALLVVFPLALLNRAAAAAQRGQWHKAARLHKWVVVLHPSPWARLGLRLRRAHSTDGATGYVAALRRIEATGSARQRAFARLMLAHERRDWNELLMLARADDVDFSEAKPREIRALGELGRLDEMVATYADAERRLLPQSRQECRLFVFAFTGRIAAVQQLLNGALSALDDDAKAYWTAIVRLRHDRQDEVARGTLTRLAESAASDGVRRSAAQQLRQTDLAGAPAPSNSEDTERIIERMLQNSSPSVLGQQNRRPLFQANTKSHIRGLLLLVLIVLLALLQRYYR
jgi:ABC-type multidrug transport system fused ATPase/permease subunit